MKLHCGKTILCYSYYNFALSNERKARVSLYGISFGRLFIGISTRENFKNGGDKANG